MPYVTQQMVLDFHRHTGLSIGDPRSPDISVEQDLRVELIREEFRELRDALYAGDVVKTADALGDLLYVINGAAVSWGIDLPPVFEEIHRSNMTKDGANRRSDGKVLKGPDYTPPDIQSVLDQSAAEFTLGYAEGLDMGGWREAEPINIVLDQRATYDSKEVQGQLTSYGTFVFSCTQCDRTHAASNRLGTRGGFATEVPVECMCGKKYTVHFAADGQDPKVTE